MMMISRFFAKCTQAVDANAGKRILCDCNGTLINADRSLNEPLFSFLEAAKKKGYEVVLVSDHLAMTQMVIESLMEERDLPSTYLGDVQPKRDYAWRGAFIVFDDDPSSQSASAQHVMLPDDPRIAVMTSQLRSDRPLQITPNV